jgi:hypothetical protein
VVATQRLDAVLGDGDQVLDDRRRDVVAVQRRIERRLVAARAGVEPVALQHSVVERAIRVLVVGKCLVERPVGGRTILLVRIRLEHRPVLAVGQRDVVPSTMSATGTFASAVVNAE